jgi:hypothetical protein
MNREPSRTRPLQPALQATAEDIRQGIVQLKIRLDEVSAYEPTSVTDQNDIPEIEALSAEVVKALTRTFGANTPDFKRYSDAAYFDNWPFYYIYSVPIEQVQASLARSKARAIAMLTQAMAALEERLEEPSAVSASPAIAKPQAFDHGAFVVHG